MAIVDRLRACLEELRSTSGSGGAEQQTHQHRLLKLLYALQRRWRPELVNADAQQPKRLAAPRASTLTQLFPLLLEALLVYSGNHMGSTGSATSGASSPMTMSLTPFAANTSSECVHALLCDLLVRTFDFSAGPMINEILVSKNSSIYVKASIMMVLARLSIQEALPFMPDAMTFANKNIRAADYYMKQCLLESATRLLDHPELLSRLAIFHVEAVKMVNKSFQDKMPEVRRAAAALLHVVVVHTPASSGISSSHSNGSSTGSGNGSSSGGGSGNGTTTSGSGGSNSANSSSSGSHGNANAISLDALMQIASKGMDDAAPEARRAFSVVVGIILAKFATSSSDHEMPLTETAASASQGPDDDGGRNSHGNEQHHDKDTAGSSHGKSKLGFKLPSVHVPGMSTITLSRRKATTVNFASISSIIVYLKDMIITRYVSSNPNQNHGGILASYSIALCNMFEWLPPDMIAETHLQDVIDALLRILDHPFALGDLTRARNAVCFVLRNGIQGCLTERQQEALLGIYIEKIKHEAAATDGNHHKLLSLLVEVSHMMHALAEASVSHGQNASVVLQTLLSHEKQSVRFQASVSLASLVTTLPYCLKGVLMSCIQSLRETADLLLSGDDMAADMATSASAVADVADNDFSNLKSKAHLYALQGRSAAIGHIFRSIQLKQNGGLSHVTLSDVLQIAERLVESQFINGCADSVWLTCTRAGWSLIGTLVAIRDDHWIQSCAHKLLNLWLQSSVLQTRESSLELLRIEAAVVALQGFLSHCKKFAVSSDGVDLLVAHILHVFTTAVQDPLGNPMKRRGQIARYRLITALIKCFSSLPPVYSDSYVALLDFIVEFTTSQSLTSHQSPLVAASSTFLHNALSVADDPMEMVSLPRLVPGDYPSVYYSRELNLILALQQNENALTDTEVEVQYQDHFWAIVCELDGVSDTYDRGICSSFTYVRLVDASVFLFGRLFHFVPEDLQLRSLQHCATIMSDGRVDCVLNVCSLLFSAIREAKMHHVTPKPGGSWSHQMQNMLCEMLSNDNSKIRRGAGEALGMLASLLNETNRKNLIHELEKRLAPEKLPFGTGSSDVPAATNSAGAAFSLACIKRVCGSSVSIDTGLIFRFAGECSQPLRTWILHSWSIIVESVNSTGGDYEQYVKSTTSLIDAHVLAGFKYSKVNKKGSRWQTSAKVAVARIINDVVATLGPELSGSPERLSDYFTIWSILRQDGDARIELEYLKFLEQIIVFAPTRLQRNDLEYILSVVSGTYIATSAVIPAIVSPSGASSTLRATFDNLGEQLAKHALLRSNDLSRSLLQQVSMSCIRTLVERDPALIHEQNLQCLLFHAMHMECINMTWQFLPGMHGMWDFVSFKSSVSCKTFDGWQEIRKTIFALIDIDGGAQRGAQPCIWALFCRSIAIGESANSFGADEDQLMMSPKGIENILGSITASNGDDSQTNADEAWGTNFPEKMDDAMLSSTAVANQLDLWRATKKSVSDLMVYLPPLSRPVRHFAVECVLRVFELVSSGSQKEIGSHFDLVDTRRHFLDVLIESQRKLKQETEVLPPSISVEPRSGGNFLCMYLDEFVTLACHVSTTSADGHELQMFQCAGLRLLNMVVKQFAASRDPEVASGDAYLLEPYQAQISAAVRQAVKLTSQMSSATDSDQSKEFYAPLLIEAHAICGASISSRLIQDKVALGRILRMVNVEDFTHSHFVGDEIVRTKLSLANLACVAQLLVSSITGAIATSDGDKRAVTSSPLVKAMVQGLSANFDILVESWMEVTYAYGFLMQGSVQWPSKTEEMTTKRPLIKTLLPLLSSQEAQSHSLQKLREMYKHYWPMIANAIIYTHVYVSSRDNSKEQLTLLLAFAVFHVGNTLRDQMQDELMPAIEAIPVLVNTLASGINSSDELIEPILSSLSVLTNASLRSYGSVQVAALTALFKCLTREAIAVVSKTSMDPAAQANILMRVSQAALCPFEILRQLCDPKKQQNSAAIFHQSEAHTLEVMRCATSGIIFVHSTEAMREYTVDAMQMAEQCYRYLATQPSLHETTLVLSRASIESVVAYAKSPSGQTSSVSERIRTTLWSSFATFAQWLKEELIVARELKSFAGLGFVMRLLANYTTSYPTYFSSEYSDFHAAVAFATAEILAADSTDNSTLQLHVFQGILAIVRKLVAAQDAVNAGRYFARLGPELVQVLDACGQDGSSTNADLSGLQEAEELLRLLLSQLDGAHGAVFVRMILPKILGVLQSSMPLDRHNQCSRIVTSLLLSLAQTRAAAFKDAVIAMAPTTRSVLETALRNAIAGTTAAPASTAPVGRTLDLSRYG